MLGTLTILALLSAAPDGPKNELGVEPGEFRAWFEAACQNELEIPPAVAQEAARYQYVFVAGIFNERIGGYFAQNAKELRALGVPRSNIHYIYPSSHESLPDNADAVCDRFREIIRDGPEPLVVIAHSRGACDTLAFALENPELVRKHVKAMFLVQGPFGGTGLADYIAGEGPPMDGQIPLKYRVLARVLIGAERRMLARGKHGGLAGLTHDESREFWDKLLKNHADAVSIVEPKTFYVTSEARTARLKLFQRATASYLDSHFGPNDGVVALEDQFLPELGTILAVLDAGHSDLTSRALASRVQKRRRHALVESIVMAIGRSEIESAHDRLSKEKRSKPERKQRRAARRSVVEI
jgi:pimeloyl-ACP methyl ester carboxylesterase